MKVILRSLKHNIMKKNKVVKQIVNLLKYMLKMQLFINLIVLMVLTFMWIVELIKMLW